MTRRTPVGGETTVIVSTAFAESPPVEALDEDEDEEDGEEDESLLWERWKLPPPGPGLVLYSPNGSKWPACKYFGQ